MKKSTQPLFQSYKSNSSNLNQQTLQNYRLDSKKSKDLSVSSHHIHSKSYVFDEQDRRKLGIGLRKSVYCQKSFLDSSSNNATGKKLRNTITSVYTDKDKYILNSSNLKKSNDQIGYKALKSTTESIKQQLKKQQNYQKIIEKLSKKQQIINQLKQLSQYNVTDLIRKPQTENKHNRIESLNSIIVQNISRVNIGDQKMLNSGTKNSKERQFVNSNIYSPVYQQRSYKQQKMNTEGQKYNGTSLYSSIKKDVYNSNFYCKQQNSNLQGISSPVREIYQPQYEKTHSPSKVSPGKNLNKSRYQHSPVKLKNEYFNPNQQSNVYYTPKASKEFQFLQNSIQKLGKSNYTSTYSKEQITGSRYDTNYKTSRYKDSFSQPNTPLLNKADNKIQRNLVDVKKKIDYNLHKDQSVLNKSSVYFERNYAEPKSPVLQKKQTKKSYVNIQDIRIASQKRNRPISSHFTPGKPKIYDFQLIKQLGQGKFGTVYQALHRQTRSIYALKKLSKKYIKQNLMTDQLIKEIKIQSFCNHENILKLYGFFDDAEFIYIILEYMEEGTLFQTLKKQNKIQQKETAVKIKQIAQGLKYLHENGITHRDIKPENIVLSHGTGKLCDFGWATVCNGRRKTYCGTFDYVAPQILQGDQYDETVDLWCLGVLAYELMVGKAPFYHLSKKQTMKRILNVQNQTIEFPSHLSKETVSFIESLIRKNPEQRMSGKQILKHPFLTNVNTH